jgi:hypothetical protein
MTQSASALVPPAAPPATTIDEVIARMQAIEAVLPSDDGVACFNRMYLEVTLAVGAQVQQGVFGDAAFMERLDVVFANRYFAAVDALSGPTSHWPVAWRPLLAARSSSDIEPIQFALAGMNTHINHDLPLAVVRACQDLATSPTDGTHHEDYLKINALLNAAEQSVRESFEPPELVEVDRHTAAVTNLVAEWSITTARDVAWQTTLALWEVRDNAFVTTMLTGSLATMVAMASRALLVAV